MTAHVGPPVKSCQRSMSLFLHARQRVRKVRYMGIRKFKKRFLPTYPAPTMKTHVVDNGLLVDISVMLNDIRTAADL